IAKIAAALPQALGDERGSSDAINAIAGQMQAPLASGVIYLSRTLACRRTPQSFPPDRFLPDLGWLDPDTVQTRLSKISGTSKATTPGLHGTGVQGVTVEPAGVALTEGGAHGGP